MVDRNVTLAADDLRVTFVRRGDRYSHFIEAFQPDGNWKLVLESLEGLSKHRWPPSPPFQQLHVEERPAGRVLLLIGMAGRTHWSAAVEVADDRRGLVFDIAARIQERPIFLGTLYDGPSEDSEVCIRTATTVVTQLPWRIVPAVASAPPATVSWRYVVTRRDEA